MSIDIGKRIKDLLYFKKMSQGDLADKLGITRQSLSIWMTSKRMPKIENLEKIADILEVPLSTLLDENKGSLAGDIDKDLKHKIDLLEEKNKIFELELSLLKKDNNFLKEEIQFLKDKIKL